MILACHADAERLLRANGQSVDRILSVDHDSILFVSGFGAPRTAWLHASADGKNVTVKLEVGFKVDPPMGLHPQLEPADQPESD